MTVYPQEALLTCAFMFPEPPTDRRHPWLWTLLPGGAAAPAAGEGEGGPAGEPAGFRRLQLPPALCGGGGGGGDGGGGGGLEEDPGPGGGGWACWNVSGARRWFEPVVLNLAKDKHALFAPP